MDFRSKNSIVLRLVGLFAAIFTGLLVGCSSAAPLVDHTSDPNLARVHAALETVVRACNEDQERDWYSGWAGNAWVNFRKGPARGLCYHWQSAVYEGVLPTVRGLGWEAGGLMVHTDSFIEHHVVLVFDPSRIRYEDILGAKPPRAVYVLDAWRRGRADMFTLDDWMANDDEIAVTAVLETPTPIADLDKKPEPESSEDGRTEADRR